MLADLLAAQRETNRLLRVLAYPTLRQSLIEALGSDAERRAYELSDGSRTVREIAKGAGASVGSISSWGTKWKHLGLADEANGRTRHIVPLSALGLAVDSR